MKNSPLRWNHLPRQLRRKPIVDLLATFTARQVSFSQLGEDVWLLRNWINTPRKDLVIVDVGAYDPWVYSNSALLERNLGANCFLLEPNPARAARIQRLRSSSTVYCVAVSDSFGLAELAGSSAVAGIRQHMTEQYLKRWDLDEAAEFNAATIPLRALQSAEQMQFIDLLSIDVQGAELKVLDGIDWSTPIGCICIELEGEDLEKDEQCRQMLIDRGFVLSARLAINEFWTFPGYERRSLIWSPSKVIGLNDFVFPFLEPHASESILERLAQPAIDSR